MAVRELGTMAAEEPHATGLPDLEKRFVDEAAHRALVRFARYRTR